MTAKRERSPSADSADAVSAHRARKRAAYRVHQHATFASLSADVYRQILSHLSFSDLCVAQESCLFPANSAGASLLRDAHHTARAELSALRPLVRFHRRTTAQRPDSSPLALASWTRPLHLTPVASGLPAGIGHLRSLRELHISAFVALLNDLPPQLSRCSALRRLFIAGHAFTEIPLSVLSLSHLTMLDLSGCRKLGELPKDVGVRLRRLRKINLVGCAGVRSLPRSLLRTLESNCRRVKEPLVVSPGLFEKGYLRERVGKKRYPRLAVLCEEMFCANEENRVDAEEEEEEVDFVVEPVDY